MARAWRTTLGHAMGGGRGGKTADVPDPAAKEEDAAASPLMASGGGKTRADPLQCGAAAATAGPSVPKPVAVGQRPSPLGAACASAAGSGRSEIFPLERTVEPSAPQVFSFSAKENKYSAAHQVGAITVK